MSVHLPTRTQWYWLIRSVKFIFVPLALCCLFYFAWISRGAMVAVIENARIGYLSAAIASWALLHLVSPLFAVISLKGCGARINYQTALNIHIRNLPARYLPGGIWHTVGRVIDFHRHGVSSDQLASFVLLENVLAAAITLMIGGTCVWFFRGFEGWGKVAAFGALGGFAALLLMPSVLALRKDLAKLPCTIYAGSIGVITLFWLIASTTFIFYLYSFPSVLGSASVIEIGGTYLFSWGVGFISIFAPQGIGIFEAVAGGMLKGSMSLGGAITVVAGFRIVVLLADSLVWVAYRFLHIREHVKRHELIG